MVQRKRGRGDPVSPRFLSLVARLFSAIKANLALFCLPLWTGADQPLRGAGQEGRSAQPIGPPWTSSREMQTLLNGVVGECVG